MTQAKYDGEEDCEVEALLMSGRAQNLLLQHFRIPEIIGCLHLSSPQPTMST